MKTLFEEMGGTYGQCGDYLIPNLTLPAEKENYSLGKYGRMRLNYLKTNRRILFANLLTSGKLSEHLREVEERVTTQVEQIVTALAKANCTNEELKVCNQMCWVGLMNNYRYSAEEIVMREVVYE